MMSDKTPKLGERELDLMNALWDVGDATVSDVHAELAKGGNEIAYNTVQTMLNRLEGKGLVSRELEGRAYRYRALIRRPAAAGGALTSIIDGFFGGSAEELARYLVDRDLDDDELGRMEELIKAKRKGRK